LKAHGEQLTSIEYNNGIMLCGYKTIIVQNLSSLKIMFDGFLKIKWSIQGSSKNGGLTFTMYNTAFLTTWCCWSTLPF
jgi:hypothetical protein